MSKSVKDGKILTQKEKNKIALDKAKKKIKDKDYNVFSGDIQKNKNNQTNVAKNIKDAKKRKESYYDVVNGKKVLKKRNIAEDLGKVLPFLPAGRIAGVASKVPGVKSGINKLIGSAKNFLKGDKKPKKLSVTGGGGSGTKGQGSGKFITQRKNRPTGTQITKPKNTQVKKPSTSLVNRTNRRFSPNRGPQQLANRAAVVTGLSEVIKPKKVIAKETKIEKPKIIKPKITKPNKSPSPNVKKEKLKKIGPAKDYTGKFVNKKGEVAYDSIGDFFKNITGTAKKRARPENRKRIQAATKGATKGIGFTGKSVGNPFKFNRGGKMKKMTSGGSLKSIPPESKGLQALKRERPDVVKKMGFMKGGGKVVKMRGGGAATKGMNFNRGY